MNRLKVVLTHDVDRIHKTFQYLTHDVRTLRIGKLRTIINGKRPYWQFDQIMELEGKYGIRSTFFFLQESIPFNLLNPKNWKLSLGRYSLLNPEVKRIIRELDENGWEIGLHGSYNSYKDINLLKNEKAIIEDILGNKVIGVRQHYLNLDIPKTWQLQREAGFDYDASFGKKRDIGYRDNRYYPFKDNASNMYVIPLALMEGYLFSKAKNNIETAWLFTKELMDEAERNNAVFSVLWHQRMFNEEEFPGYKLVYEKIIKEAKARGAEFLTCRQIYERYSNKV